MAWGKGTEEVGKGDKEKRYGEGMCEEHFGEVRWGNRANTGGEGGWAMAAGKLWVRGKEGWRYGIVGSEDDIDNVNDSPTLNLH